MYLLSILVFLVLCIVFMIFWTGGVLGNIVYFIDMPTIITLALLVLPMMIIAGVMKDFNNAFRLGAKVKKPAKQAEIRRAIDAVSFAMKAFWIAGIFGFLVPTMNTFLHFAGELDVLLAMKYIAVGSIPLCYASMVSIVLLPLRARLKRRLDELCEENNEVAGSAKQAFQQEREDTGVKQSE